MTEAPNSPPSHTISINAGGEINVQLDDGDIDEQLDRLVFSNSIGRRTAMRDLVGRNVT